jgi:acyl-CoA hydrolase
MTARRATSDAPTTSPANLGEIPDYYRRFIDPSEIAVIKTCPKDKHGFYNFSLATLWERAIVERAKLVFVEESAGLPYLDGLENAVIIDLYRAGVVTGARKTLYPGKVVCTFGVGTRAQYETADRNPDFLCHAVDLINLPDVVMQNDRVVSINNTTQMDLQGQAASESAGHRHISGTGGQSQFVRGAYASAGGKSFICMSSTYERRGARANRIVVDLTPGNVVTATRADIMYVVTEHGIVNLKGKSVPERAQAMISIAHPDFRDELEREARGHGLIPKGFF